jgi:PAS domain S-box-containing protein
MDDLLNYAPCGFLSFADDGSILTINATLLGWLGYESEELTGRHIETLMGRGARIFYQTHFFPALKLHGKAEEIYFSLRHKNGDTMPVLTNAARYAADNSSRYDCVFIAMHQRNQYEDEILQAKKAAEEANQAKAKFLSMISHELRTPLSAIMGYTEVLGMDIHGPVTAEQRDDLHRISSASRYLLDLLNDILNFAQMEAGQVEVRPTVIAITEILNRSESLIVPILQQHQLGLSRENCDHLQAFADADRVQQIVLNLLTNAIKFTPAGGHITLICDEGEDVALIHVRDTGCGISAEQLPTIFDPFVQGEHSFSESNQRGVGLGLAISRDLARAMNGDLTVQSTPDKGSTFTISLPLAASISALS